MRSIVRRSAAAARTMARPDYGRIIIPIIMRRFVLDPDGHQYRGGVPQCPDDGSVIRPFFGEAPVHSPILAPLLALVLWSFVIGVCFTRRAFPAIMRLGIVYDPQRPNEAFHAQFRPLCAGRRTITTISWSSRRCSTPWCCAWCLLEAGAGLNAVLAWLYVGLRVAHSLVHVLINVVLIRFALFAAASLVSFAFGRTRRGACALKQNGRPLSKAAVRFISLNSHQYHLRRRTSLALPTSMLNLFTSASA